MRKSVLAVICLVLLLSFVPFSPAPPVTQAQSASHPRLWIRQQDIATYQAWANDGNPLWVQLNAIAENGRAAMEAGTLPAADDGTTAWVEYPVENYAMLFAFMSLVHPDEATRTLYAGYARTLLMAAIHAAVPGVAEAPFQYEAFALSDRSRWYGLGFPLTVDWIYPTLTAEDKAAIHTVFSRWCSENRVAGTTTNNHPEPVGVVNDPALVQDRASIRFSSNNYYAAHMRNMGLMGLALDAADDPDGAMATCLNEAVGAWLYVTDFVQRNDVRGGLSAEGLEYSPQTNGYNLQLLLALYTAEVGTALGPQVSIDDNPFWQDSVTAYVHSLSPRPAPFDWRGDAYQPAWYGSGQNYLMPDHIESFGPLGIYDRLTGNTARLDTLRWIQTQTPIGGEAGLLDRMNFEQFHVPILYFMLFDPNLPPATDPRTDWPTSFYAAGMRRYLARTDWSPDATWFTYGNSWNWVDHQAANANAIEFYRGGEWLTKVRVGYDLDYLSSDQMNTLAVQNTQPEPQDFRQMLWERGSQWLYNPAGDPAEPIITEGEGYVAIYGEATQAYNSTYENMLDVQHASRSVVWLQPDVLVIYDRAVTASAGFKRFWLNLPAPATTEGNVTTMVTASGQQLQIVALLPTEITTSVIALGDEPSGSPAVGEIMTHRYGAEVVGNPTEAVFVHVLIGMDAGATAPTITLVNGDPNAPVVQIGESLVTFGDQGRQIEVQP